MSIAQHFVRFELLYVFGFQAFMALPQIERYYKLVTPAIAQHICPSPLANDTGLYVSPEDIAAILRQPVPTITVTHSTRVALAPFTAWSETTTKTESTTTTSSVASTTFTETRTQFLRTPVEITHWIPSGTSTAVEYRTLWKAEYFTTTVVQEASSTATAATAPGAAITTGYFENMPSQELAEMLLAFLAVALIGLGVCYQRWRQGWRYRHVLQAYNGVVLELENFEKELARVKKEKQLQNVHHDEAVSEFECTIDHIKQIVNGFDGFELTGAHLDEAADPGEVVRAWWVFHKGTEKKRLTEETLKLQEEKEDNRQEIARLQSRVQRLEDQIHKIAGEADLGRGVQRVIFDLESELGMAEEKLRHLQGQ
jgi:hypothetical protein